MRDWVVVRALFADCRRADVLVRLLACRLLTLSGAIMVTFLVLLVGSLAALPWLLTGWSVALAAALLLPVLMWLGALIIDDRVRVVYPEFNTARQPLLRAYRRGFFAVRYLELLERLRSSGLFQVASLEAALRCCEAELALASTPEMRLSRARPFWLAVLSIGLFAGAPWLAAWYPEWVPLMQAAAVVLGVIAALLGAAVLAQPAIAHHRELHCMLVWALEEARAEAPSH